MTEYELDKICENNPHCNCNCMKCGLFSQWIKSEMNQ